MNNQGGKRQGSGRKKLDPTTLLNLRIKVDLKANLRLKYGKELNKLIIVFLENLAVCEGASCK